LKILVPVRVSPPHASPRSITPDISPHLRLTFHRQHVLHTRSNGSPAGRNGGLQNTRLAWRRDRRCFSQCHDSSFYPDLPGYVLRPAIHVAAISYGRDRRSIVVKVLSAIVAAENPDVVINSSSGGRGDSNHGRRCSDAKLVFLAAGTFGARTIVARGRQGVVHGRPRGRLRASITRGSRAQRDHGRPPSVGRARSRPRPPRASHKSPARAPGCRRSRSSGREEEAGCPGQASPTTASAPSPAVKELSWRCRRRAPAARSPRHRRTLVKKLAERRRSCRSRHG